MSRQPSSCLCDLCSLTANTAALHTIRLLLRRSAADADGLFDFLLWCLLLWLSYFLLRLLSGSRQFAQKATVVCACALAVQTFLTCHYGTPPARLLSWLYTLLLWGIPYGRAAEFLTHTTSVEKRMLDFELSALVMILAVAVCACGIYPPAAALPSTAGTLLALFSLSRRRMSGTRGRAAAAGRLCLFLIPALSAGSGFLFLRFGAAPLTQALTFAIGLLRKILLGIGRLLTDFLLWLFSLLPVSRQELPPLSPEPAPSLERGSLPSGAGGEFILICLLLLLLLGGGLAFFFFLRGARPSPGAGSVNGKQSALRIPRFSLRRLLNRLRFTLTYLRHRNTPSGLLVWLERKSHTLGEERRPGETCRHFLARIAKWLPDCAAELAVLADCLDRQYFDVEAEKTSLAAPEIKKMRRKLDVSARQKKTAGTGLHEGKGSLPA